MCWVRMIHHQEATGELKSVYDEIAGASGKPVSAHILTSHSLNPEALRHHYRLYRTIMFGPSGLSRAEREMVATIVSAANRCHY